MSLRSSDSDTSSTREENREIHQHVVELHLALKYYFNSSEQQHILYLLNSYYNNGNLNYLCLRLRPILDTVMKRSLLRYLVCLVPKQHTEHYHKLVADLYNGLLVQQIPQPQVPLTQMPALKLDSGGHAFADLQDALGLSDDYVRYYEQMLNEVPSQQSTTILSRQQSHHKSNPALYESSPESPAKPSRYPSRHDVSAPRDPPSSLNGHDYPDNTNTRQDEQEFYAPLPQQTAPPPSYVQTVEHQIEVTCKKKFNASYGFKLKGGSEVGEPIRIGEVVRGSEADKAGIKVDDRIISVNGTSFDNMTSTSAIKAIRANKKLKMVLGRLLSEPVASAPPESSLDNHPKTNLTPLVNPPGPTSYLTETSLNNQRNDLLENSEPPSPVSPSDLIWINERGEQVANPSQVPGYGRVSKVHIVLPQARSPLGIRIRGGSEFGIGIFITSVEPYSYAAKHGLKVGDQIIAVNNEDLSQATHRKAIDMISEDKILVMSVRHTGCIPEVSPSSKLLHPSHVAAPASAGPPTHFTHFPLPPDNHRDPHVKYANSSYPNDFAMTKSPQRSVASSDHSSERKSFLSTELPSASRTDSPSNSGSSFGRGNMELEEREMLDRNFDSRTNSRGEQHTLVREKTISRRSAEEHHSGTLSAGVPPPPNGGGESRFNQIRGRYSPNPNKQNNTHVDRNRTLRNNSNSAHQKEQPPSLSSPNSVPDLGAAAAAATGTPNHSYSMLRRSPAAASTPGATSRYLDVPRRGGGRLDQQAHAATSRSNSMSRNLPIPPMTDEDFMDEKLPNKHTRKVRVEKVVKILGIAIEGGADTSLQLPRIIRIKPESCAWYSGQLSVGMKLLEVNDKPLYGLTHVECGKKIAESFQGSYRDYIDFLVEEADVDT